MSVIEIQTSPKIQVINIYKKVPVQSKEQDLFSDTSKTHI